MGSYIEKLEERLREKGFAGRLLMLTSAGGVTDAQHMAESPNPFNQLGSAAAPVAGRHFAQLDARSDTAIVTDAGGTTYDVSLIRHGVLPWTRETQVGEPHQYFDDRPTLGRCAEHRRRRWKPSPRSTSTGFFTSARRAPVPSLAPPATDGEGSQSTVTDACVALGYIDPGFFLGGAMHSRRGAAERAVAQHVATPLGLSIPDGGRGDRRARV